MKPQVDPEGRRLPPGQCLQALGFFREIPTCIGERVERRDVVIAGEAESSVVQGESDYEGSLHFAPAVLELTNGRQQSIADPQGRKHGRQRCRTGKI